MASYYFTFFLNLVFRSCLIRFSDRGLVSQVGLAKPPQNYIFYVFQINKKEKWSKEKTWSGSKSQSGSTQSPAVPPSLLASLLNNICAPRKNDWGKFLLKTMLLLIFISSGLWWSSQVICQPIMKFLRGSYSGAGSRIYWPSDTFFFSLVRGEHW